MEIKKFQVYRNDKYLEFVRSKPCGWCGICGPSEAHHVRRSFWGSGTSQKPHDYVAVPRCRDCHRECHAGKTMDYIAYEIINLLMEYIEAVAARRAAVGKK